MEIYGVSLHIQSECGKTRTRKTPNIDTFHAVTMFGNILYHAVIACSYFKEKEINKAIIS